MPQDAASLDRLHADVAALQRRARPWWRNPGNAIAGLAFLLSLATTAVSIYEGRQHDLHDAQTELAGVVEKLSALPLTFADFQARHPEAPVSNISDLFNNQTTMLAHEGYGLAKRLGTDASPGELERVADALRNTGNIAAAVELLQLAVAGSDTWFDKVGAQRFLGSMLIMSATDDVQRARGATAFAAANALGQDYPELGGNPTLLAYTRGLTEERWAEALAMSRCGEAGPHLQAAAAHLSAAGGLFDAASLLQYNARMADVLATCPPAGRLPFLPRPVQPTTPGEAATAGGYLPQTRAPLPGLGPGPH